MAVGGGWRGLWGALDPSRGAPGERILAPVPRVRVECHEFGNDEGVCGDIYALVANLEGLVLSAGVFRNTR
jgi:hypothetical protein